MYTVNRKCSTALRLLSTNSSNFKSSIAQQELSAFKFNRDQIKQNSYFYSTQTNVIKPIKKLMVANRGIIVL